MRTVPTEVASGLADVLGIRRAVETGTYLGAGTRRLAGLFDTVVSIELSPVLVERARRSLMDLQHVTVIPGDSRVILPKIVTCEQPTFYWLDGHWCRGGPVAGAEAECPVVAEIDAIAQGHDDDCILIDDAYMFATRVPDPWTPSHWPELTDVLDQLRAIRPASYITVIDGVVVAVPRTGKHVIDNWGEAWVRRVARLEPASAVNLPTVFPLSSLVSVPVEPLRPAAKRLRRYLRRELVRRRGPLPGSAGPALEQRHDDSSLTEILRRLENVPPRCIELGAGTNDTTVCSRLADQGWDAVFLLSDPTGRLVRARKYANSTHVRTLLAAVDAQNVNAILEAEALPRDLGVLSIAVEGDEVSLWRALEAVDPRVVIIARCERMAAGVSARAKQETPAQVVSRQRRCTTALLETVASDKGYHLAVVDGRGTFFVHRQDRRLFPSRGRDGGHGRA